MAKKVEVTTELEQALLDDANDLLDALHRYGENPTPHNWTRVDEARVSLSDTTYGTLRPQNARTAHE